MILRKQSKEEDEVARPVHVGTESTCRRPTEKMYERARATKSQQIGGDRNSQQRWHHHAETTKATAKMAAEKKHTRKRKINETIQHNKYMSCQNVRLGTSHLPVHTGNNKVRITTMMFCRGDLESVPSRRDT